MCEACRQMPEAKYCLEHTCPDCGLFTSGCKNEAGELVHECGNLDTCMVRHAVHEAAALAAERFPSLRINVKTWETKDGRPGWTILPGEMPGYLTVKMSGAGAAMRWWYSWDQQLQMTKYFGPDATPEDVHVQVAMTLEAKMFE